MHGLLTHMYRTCPALNDDRSVSVTLHYLPAALVKKQVRIVWAEEHRARSRTGQSLHNMRKLVVLLIANL